MMSKLRLISILVIFLVSLLLQSPPAQATNNFPETTVVFPMQQQDDNPRTARLGENRGALIGGREIWSYKGQAGDVLTIKAEADKPANDADAEERNQAGLLDMLLIVDAPDGTILAKADDIQPGIVTDAVIEGLQLPTDGTYKIEVLGLEKEGSGAYTLTLQADWPTLTIANQLEETICYAYIWPTSADELGDERLGTKEVIRTNDSHQWRVARGEYNIILSDCYGNTLDVKRQFDVTQPSTLTVSPSTTDEPAGQCAVGVQLFFDGKAAEALPPLSAGFAGRENTTFANLDDEGICALALGLLRDRTGNRSGALEAYQVALEIFQASGNPQLEGTTLNNIGEVYRAQGKYDQALASLQQALEISREVGDRAGEGTIANNIGLVYHAQGRYELALEYFNQALEISRDANAGDRAGEGNALNNIGLVYRALGQYKLALKQYSFALEIRREVGDPAGEGVTLNNIGVVYHAQGKYKLALEQLHQALRIRREVGDRAGEGITLNNIGETYHAQGKYDQALASLQQALEISREVGDRAGEGGILDNIGAVYLSQGQYELALEQFQQALLINRQVGNRAGEGRILNNIGQVYLSQERYMKALEIFSKALEIAREVGARADEGAIVGHIGEVYLNQERLPKALETFQQALAILREAGNRVGEGQTLSQIGVIYQQQGQSEQALAFYEQALDVLESVRAQHADLCTRAVELFHQEGKDTEAFFTSERCRARVFLDSLASGYIHLSDNEAQALLDQEREAYAKRQAIQNALARARALDPPDSALVSVLKEQLAKAEAAYVAALTAVEARGDQLATLVPSRSTILTLSQVQALLDEQTTLVSYHVLADKGTLAFVITHDEFTVILLPNATADNLLTAQDRLYDWLNKDEPHPKPLQELHASLIAPLREQLQTPLVGIIPHQVLHYVPFAALTDGEQYLIYDHAIFILPSASVLPYIQANRKPAARSIMVLGNPEMTEPFPRLRFAEEEAKAIASLYGTPALVGKEATEREVRTKADRASILHLATHTDYDATNPLDSAIYLADDTQNDGRLEVHEVYELDLANTNLVVLSGSHTQVGALSVGDEITGFSRAFMFAGVPSIVASQWNVDDQATALLMEKFHTHLLQTEQGEAIALRQAQIELSEDRAPFYWASFALTGLPGHDAETMELVPARKPSPWPWVVGLLSSLGLILTVGFTRLTYYSGLPPTLLLRQGSSLIIVGSQYPSYNRRWESGTPLEQLVVLLAPASECIDVDEFKEKLNQLEVPADVDQIGTALNTAVQNGLFLRNAGGYRLAEPSLGRALQAHQGVESQLALAEQIRHGHPLSINARRFLVRANFKLTRLSKELLYRCEPASVDLQRLLPAIVHARLLPEDPLNDKRVLAIQKQVKRVDPEASVVFAITDQRPTDQGWAQIGTLRMSGFKVLPLSNTLINEGLRSGQERRLLRTEIEERLGGGYDPYDVRDPVAGAFTFFGRDALVSTLLRRLTEGRLVGIFGLRKLGKSSLLHALRDQAPFPVAVINLEQFVGLQSDELSELYQQILNEWAQRAQLQSSLVWTVPTIPTKAPSGAFVRATHELLECLEKKGRARLGLFLDEIEVITVHPDNNGSELSSYLSFLRPLRSLVDTDGRLSLVVAGIDSSINRINAWGHQRNPTFSLFQEVNLEPLAEGDCKQMVSSLGRQIGLVYSDESLQAIWELSAGHPFLARQLCSLLYRLRDCTPGQIEEREVLVGVERFIYDEKTAYHLDRGIWQEAGRAVLWGKDGAQVNQALLLDLARAETPVPIDDLIDHPDANARRTALFNLSHFHIIYQPQPDTYAIRFGLLRTWLRRRKLGLE